jgi:hypothetical protein
MDAMNSATVRDLLDRQQITDCIVRSCRSIDRGDEELFRSAYHSDAEEDHGAYIGGLEGLVEFLRKAMSPFSGYQRYVSNLTVDIDGDEAHVESYYRIVLRQSGADRLMINGGRYLDRLERRDGRWAIATRVVISEWATSPEGSGVDSGEISAEPSESSFIMPRRDRDDPSYRRPLRVERIEKA